MNMIVDVTCQYLLEETLRYAKQILIALINKIIYNLTMIFINMMQSLRLPGGWKLPSVISSSKVGILKKYSASIKEFVSSSPETFANQLYSADLIPFTVFDKLRATGLSPLEKASIVIDEVQRSISGTNVVDKLKKFCEILKTNGSGKMKEIVMNLEREVGMLPEEQVS